MSTAATTTASTLAPLATDSPVHNEPKRDWHASATVQMRRRVLLQILLLLKTKYGKVDAKISYIARRAELALYTQAFSAAEYRNPTTLNRRLHSLVVKLHINNLAAREDSIFSKEEVTTPALTTKRLHCDEQARYVSLTKRARSCSVDRLVPPAESPIFFAGNHDLLQHVCSFMTARDSLQLAATNALARRIVPGFISSISVSVQVLESLSPALTTSFFDRFDHLETVDVLGDEQTHLQFDFQNEVGLVRRNVICRSLLVALARKRLPKLRHVRWHYAFVDGVHDRITSQIADVVLDASRFPRLQELSLVGNAVADDGVARLCQALRGQASSSSTQLLNLKRNFIGERGYVLLEEVVATRPVTLTVKLNGNLLTSPTASS